MRARRRNLFQPSPLTAIKRSANHPTFSACETILPLLRHPTARTSALGLLRFYAHPLPCTEFDQPSYVC